jgi:hypothetical protein
LARAATPTSGSDATTKLCEEGQSFEQKHADYSTSTDGEDQSDLQSLIDQEGNKYNYHNSNGLTTFVRAPDALRGKRPESGDEDDEEHGDTTLTKSNRSRRGAGRRESSRQVGIGNNLNVETSSENNVDDLAMNQDASTDNLESQDHMNPFKNEEEGRSRSFIDKTNTTGDTNSLESAPPTRRQSSFQLERDHNITDNTIAAARLEHAFEHGDMELDEDDNEHPDSLNDRNLALELPRETAAEEECTRPTQRTPKSSAQWHGVDQSLLKNQFINAYTFPNHDLPSGFQSTNPYPGYGDPMSQDNRVEPLRGIPPMQGLRQAQATIRKSSSATGLDEVTPEVKAESSYDRDMPPPNPSHSNPPRNPKTQPRNPRCIRASSLRQHPSPSSIEPTHHSASQVPDATAEGAASETRAKRLHHVRDRSPTREN